jgi:hypothetical protein
MSINVKKLIRNIQYKKVSGPLGKVSSNSFNFNHLFSKPSIRSNLKPAPLAMQRQWKRMGPIEKTMARYRYTDYDKDNVPNKWDCQPRNKRRQDSPAMTALEKKHLKNKFGKDDTFDYNAEIDNSLSYRENKAILQEKTAPMQSYEDYLNKQSKYANVGSEQAFDYSRDNLRDKAQYEDANLSQNSEDQYNDFLKNEQKDSARRRAYENNIKNLVISDNSKNNIAELSVSQPKEKEQSTVFKIWSATKNAAKEKYNKAKNYNYEK